MTIGFTFLINSSDMIYILIVGCIRSRFIKYSKQPVLQGTRNPYPAIVGPAQGFVERPFFEMLARALRPGGVLCNMAESLCSTEGPPVDFKNPINPIEKLEGAHEHQRELRFYNSQVPKELKVDPECENEAKQLQQARQHTKFPSKGRANAFH